MKDGTIIKPLYCVHVLGPDDIYAVASRDDAFRISQEMQAYFDEAFVRTDDKDAVLMEALPSLWAGSAEQHAAEINRIGADWRQWQS